MCFEGLDFFFFFSFILNQFQSLRGLGEPWRRALASQPAVADAQVQGPMGAWSLWSLELFFCRCQSTLTAGSSASLPCHEPEQAALCCNLFSLWKEDHKLLHSGKSPSGGYALMAFRCSICKHVCICVEYCVFFLKKAWIVHEFGALMVD